MAGNKVALPLGTSLVGSAALQENLRFFTKINGVSPAVVGTIVDPHSSGPHTSAKIVQGSPTVFVGGRPLTREGDLASCGDKVIGGSADVFCGLGSATALASSGGFADPPVTFVFVETILVNTANYNLRANAVAAGWNQVAPLIATITVGPGVIISSAGVNTPAWRTGSIFPSGSKLTLVNNGYIVGRGGVGGGGTRATGFAGSGGGGGAGVTIGAAGAGNVGTNGYGGFNGNDGQPGTLTRGGAGGAYVEYGVAVNLGPGYGGFNAGKGGPALEATYDLTITNNGTIGGGGGGGGQGGGGIQRNTSLVFAAGGQGGDLGAPGSQGGTKEVLVGRGGAGIGGAGGEPGVAVIGNAYILWLAFGIRAGAIT
jgi:uncharacterized Zn-binding protein involved in type VI secretion